MARHTFAQTMVDWTFNIGTGDTAVVVGGQNVTF